MAMKQTQTKMFDFSDVGLDFCAGSKNLFPDRFKKMLALGYNTQTVSSVSVLGNQVVLTYGVNHGYVADRILKLNAVNLNGEYVIDSVTTNTVTLTIDNAPSTVLGGFTTFVAPLGWQLVHEVSNIHIYKFKHIDGTDMFARLCFQNATVAGNRNCIAIGIGRTVDLTRGIITDPNCMADLATCPTVVDATSNLRWDFTNSTARTFDNYTYNQGYATFGKAMLIGSVYHLALMYTQANNTTYQHFSTVSAIMPFSSSYDVINYPILIAQNNGASSSVTTGSLSAAQAYLASIRVTLNNSVAQLFDRETASTSFLPPSIDSFNTTTCEPIPIYTFIEKQFIGYIVGLYQVLYNVVNSPTPKSETYPSLDMDIDFNNFVGVHFMRANNNNINNGSAWIALPIEEIKIA